MQTALELPKLSKKVSLEESGRNLQADKYFQRLSFTKYLRLTLVFMWNSALPEKFSFSLPKIFCYNLSHNILRLFNVLPSFSFTISERNCDY